MTLKAIISYDGTANDQDALMLGRMLARVGATLQLAYIRHATEPEREREELRWNEAEELLESGARSLGDLDVERRVVLSGSTAEGLRWLARREGADVLIFGSDYRTAAGHVNPQRSARALLEGGPVAIAIAPANFRSGPIAPFGRMGVRASPGDGETRATANELAEAYGARVTEDEPYVDLLVIGSRPEAADGQVIITSQAHRQIESTTSPVLVLPRGVALRFPVRVEHRPTR
jgi:nucleotide-binding universal stress UspA family protein